MGGVGVGEENLINVVGGVFGEGESRGRQG